MEELKLQKWTERGPHAAPSLPAPQAQPHAALPAFVGSQPQPPREPHLPTGLPELGLHLRADTCLLPLRAEDAPPFPVPLATFHWAGTHKTREERLTLLSPGLGPSHDYALA